MQLALQQTEVTGHIKSQLPSRGVGGEAVAARWNKQHTYTLPVLKYFANILLEASTLLLGNTVLLVHSPGFTVYWKVTC